MSWEQLRLAKNFEMYHKLIIKNLKENRRFPIVLHKNILETNQIFKVASTKRQRPFTHFLNLMFRFVIAWSTNREDIIGNNICKFQPTKIVVGKPKGWKCILGLQERENIFCMKIYDKKGQKLKFRAFTIFCFFSIHLGSY